ncbi:hypothetical protein NO995_10275 [Aestuariibaculum sp. M13]|uniref:hypothetical protein n=1 Tax=Aestuariibaculum sp. M13 TaxID=2967132 RepID=UPI002159ECB2|nr:hypothetical protein [Aestuariibaculum sp. M13]MCR8668069.1 hypothetical protein [Aestuariibaculum sp. M13]
MDWNKINKSWNEFAQFHDTHLDYNERNLFHVIQCSYKVDLKSNQYYARFSGVLWKTQDGQNRNRTKILTEFKTEKKLNNLKITKTRISNLFSKKQRTDLEKSIAKDLEILNGKKLTLKNNVLEIELNSIISI